MNCPTCRQPNPGDALFCGSCGVQLVEHTGDRGEIAGLVNHQPDAAPPTPPPASQHAPAAAGTPTEAISHPSPPAAAPAPAQTPTGPLLAPPQRTSSIFPVVVAIAAIGAVVLVGALLILSNDSDDSIESTDSSPTTVDAAPASTALETAPATIAPDASTPATVSPVATAPATTATPTTVTPTIVTPTTAPSTTAPPATGPVDPAAIPPIPSEPGPVDAAGSPQVLANELPSGVAYSDVATSFTTAQALGDALALEDWEQARTLLPSLAGEPDAAFVAGYGGTNRISLMLADARRVGGVDQLLVVSVAVELDGAQTSLFCLRWDVSTGPGTVTQVGGRALATWTGNAQPEAIRNDPDAMSTVAQCTWE